MGIVAPANRIVAKEPKRDNGVTPPSALKFQAVLNGELCLPSRISPMGGSPVKKIEIVKLLNQQGARFSIDGKGFQGFASVAAVDHANGMILLVADTISFLGHSKIQSLCEHFTGLNYNLVLWIGEDQSLYNIQ